jgi:hypothetical protein
MAQIEYIPGVCNIGPDEIARRRNLGWVALAISVGLLLGLILTRVNPWWRLFVFFPATTSASGFLQAYFHFCAGYARIGIFNFGPVGERHKVDDGFSKKKDKRKGNQITLYAVLIGGVTVIIGLLLL